MTELETSFIDFHHRNPQVYNLFDKFTQSTIRRGFKKFSADMILHRIRWEVFIETVDPVSDYKINNNYSAYYARLWMGHNPDYQGFFETRALSHERLNGQQSTTPEVNMSDFEKRVEQYVALRDKKREIKERHAAELMPYNTALETLEGFLLTDLNRNGQESARCKAGTAFVKLERSVSIADGAAFRRHVIGTENFDLLDWRANKTEVTKLVEETGEPPPGVNYTTRRIVQVRRPSNGE